jgi:hypothetical protein
MKKIHHCCSRSMQRQKELHHHGQLSHGRPHILENAGLMLELIEVGGSMGT